MLQQVGKFRELYLTEQKQRLNFENELKDCKVCTEGEHLYPNIYLTVPGISDDYIIFR